MVINPLGFFRVTWWTRDSPVDVPGVSLCVYVYVLCLYVCVSVCACVCICKRLKHTRSVDQRFHFPFIDRNRDLLCILLHWVTLQYIRISDSSLLHVTLFGLKLLCMLWKGYGVVTASSFLKEQYYCNNTAIHSFIHSFKYLYGNTSRGGYSEVLTAPDPSMAK